MRTAAPKVPGFFRQYELVYIVADERDAIRVRANYRAEPPEDVYLFRLTAPIENGRRFFLDYMRDIVLPPLTIFRALILLLNALINETGFIPG